MSYSEENVEQIIDEAQVLISNGFTKGRYAANKSRHAVGVKSKAACKFCTLGAIERAQYNVGAGAHDRAEAVKRVQRVLTGDSYGNIIYANDISSTKAEHIFDALTLVKLGAWKT